MCGEELERSEVGMDALIGGRAFALRDEAAGEIRGGKRLPRLMLCSALSAGAHGQGRCACDDRLP